MLTDNVPVPAGTGLNLGLNQNSLAAIVAALRGATLGGNLTVNQISTAAGTTPVTSTLTSTLTSPLLTALGNGLFGASATLGSFTPSSAGLPIPTSFNLVGSLLGVPGLGSNIPCTLNPATSSPVTVTTSSGTTTTGTAASIGKQTSRMKAHQIRGHARVLVKVKNQTGNATGKVIAKLHGKRVGHGVLKNGKMKLRNLRHGVNKIKLRYQGDSSTQRTHKTVRVKFRH